MDGKQLGCNAFNSSCLGQWSLGRKATLCRYTRIIRPAFPLDRGFKNHAELVSVFGPSFVLDPILARVPLLFSPPAFQGVRQTETDRAMFRVLLGSQGRVSFGTGQG